MADARFDEIEVLLYGAQLLDDGVEGDAEWADAMLQRFGGEGLREKLPAIHSLVRELRLHPHADRRRVAAAMLEHHGITRAWPNVSRSQENVPQNVETLVGAFSGSGVPGRAVEAQPFSDAVVVGRRGSVVSLMMCGLVCGVLGMVLLQGGGRLIVLLILAYIVYGFFTQLRVFLRPPQLSVHRGVFSFRLASTISTAAANVSNIALARGKLWIGFHDAALVDLPQGQSPPPLSPGQQGLQLSTGGDLFTLEQVNKVRRSLGLADQRPDVAADGLSQFHTTLTAITPHTFVTPTIVLVNVAVFAALSVWSGTLMSPDRETMIQWGANYGPLTTTGQWWRLITSVFLHWGILHLLFNMWVLWGVGRLVERLVGNAAFAVAYLAAGFLGSVASVVWNNEAVVSAGASGAVFGVFGILVGFMALHRKSIPIEAINEHRNAALAFLAFNLLLGLGIPWIDMAAHVGGLAAGFGCGLLLSQEVSPAATTARRVRTAVLTVVALVVCGASVYFLPV
jgi:membrane associated rhomboid family serine protease